MYKTLKNKNILIIITGSIAAYKSCEIVRLLRKEGVNVQVMMTSSAQNFVGKTTFKALTGKEVITDLFSNTDKTGLEHVNLAIDLDAIIVVPATANIISKVANGVADEIASTTLSICEQPILFVPAMNYRMWQNPAIQNSVKILKKRDIKIIDPEKGLLASLHEGEGRLPSINKIMNAIRELFNFPLILKNKNVLITAGPTREPIDPIRFISNRSSGKMGYALAKIAKDMGANVKLISGPVTEPIIPEIELKFVETANEMKNLMVKYAASADYIFMAAAVGDYRVKNMFTDKLKNKNLTLELESNTDILKLIKNKTKAIITGFSLEIQNGESEAKRKQKEKKLDYIILNYANEIGAGFNSTTNRVIVFNKNGVKKEFGKDRKDRIAKKIKN